MQQLTLSQVSLQKQPSSITEMYIPLWVYSSGETSYVNVTTPGSQFVAKGSTSTTGSSASSIKLHTLNPNWSPTQKFAFEASIYTIGGYTAYAALWDVTSNSLVSGSQLSTTSSTATLLRSGSFTLVPGHQYAVTLWSSSSSGGTYLTKAHLVAFLS